MAKRNVLIVYEASCESLKKAALKIQNSAQKDAQVAMRSALEVRIPDILAADSFFFGAETPASPEYAEIDRILKCANLAGRNCGLYTQSSLKALDYLSGMIQDSELKACPDRIQLSINPDDVTLSAWVDSILKN
jgi:hypothetical protein